MLADTSNTSMTVPSTRGKLTVAWGRASATRMIARPEQEEQRRHVATEAWSRSAGRLPGPYRAEAAYHGAPPVLYPQVEGDDHRDKQQRKKHRRPDESHGFTAIVCPLPQ